MNRSKVAVVRTSPETVLEDYHRVMNLAGYRDVIAPDADTALKINITWHLFFPGCSTPPWQLEGVIRAMKRDGYDPALMHACHNRTVVIDAHLGERENKQLCVVEAHGLRNVHLYESGEEWIDIWGTQPAERSGHLETYGLLQRAAFRRGLDTNEIRQLERLVVQVRQARRREATSMGDRAARVVVT